MSQLDTAPVWRPALPAILVAVVVWMIMIGIFATVSAYHV